MHIKLYLGQNEDCSPGDGISVSSGRLLQGGRRGSHAIYKFVTKGADNLNIKVRYQVKEFSILCMGRCKPLGSLNTFLSYAPQLSGAKSYFSVHLKEWQMVAPCIPQLLSNHHGQGAGGGCVGGGVAAPIGSQFGETLFMFGGQKLLVGVTFIVY